MQLAETIPVIEEASGGNPIRKLRVGLVFQTHQSMMSQNGPNLVRNEIHLNLEDESWS